MRNRFRPQPGHEQTHRQPRPVEFEEKPRNGGDESFRLLCKSIELDTTGFPTVVDVTGGAPISSLTLPAAAEGPHTVTVTGANGSTASTTVTYDTVAPIPSAALSPAPAGSGWNLTSPVQVTL